MSLILDALRKMEQERKTRHGGTVDIRPAVLDRRDGPPFPANRLLLVAVGAVLLLAGVVTGLLVKKESPSSRQNPEQAPLVTEGKPVPATAPAAVPLPAEPVRPVPAAIVPSALPATPPHRVPSEESAGMPSEPAERGITISGIAWQDDRGLRRAVVNGLLVGEGAEIAGARIVEIRERSVRFSRGDRSFEVSYSSALPSR